MTLLGSAGADVIDHALRGWSGIALVDGGGGDDTIAGSGAADTVNGCAGNDALSGLGGNDIFVLRGGAGADRLDGGAGADDFVYLSAGESRGATVETILGFVLGQDDIDLSAIHASAALAGNQDFAFVGAAAFGRVAGQLRVDSGAVAGLTLVQADTNGDARADMEIRLQGALGLVAGDFLL